MECFRGPHKGRGNFTSVLKCSRPCLQIVKMSLFPSELLPRQAHSLKHRVKSSRFAPGKCGFSKCNVIPHVLRNCTESEAILALYQMHILRIQVDIANPFLADTTETVYRRVLEGALQEWDCWQQCWGGVPLFLEETVPVHPRLAMNLISPSSSLTSMLLFAFLTWSISVPLPSACEAQSLHLLGFWNGSPNALETSQVLQKKRLVAKPN